MLKLLKNNPVIEIDYIINNDSNLSLFNLCFKNCRNINDFNPKIDSFKSILEIKQYFGELPYLVYCNNIPIGFIFPCRDKNSNALGMSIWIKEYSYKKSFEIMNIMILSGILLDYHIYKTKGFYEYIEFDTASTYITKVVSNILPGIKNTKIRKDYIFLYEKFENIDLSIVDKIYSSGFSVGFSFLTFDFKSLGDINVG